MRCRVNTCLDDSGNVIVQTYRSVAEPRKNYYFEHHHTECEISLCVSGGGTYATRDGSYEFSGGDGFLFGSNEAHCITDLESVELLNLRFEPRILWESRENTELLALFNARGENFSNKMSGDGELFRLVLKIEEELENKRAGYRIAVKNLVLETLIHILRSYDMIEDDKVLRSSTSAGRLSAAIDYINENLDARLALSHLAEIACMTPTYFSAVFKKYNGMSPWDYITIKRVEKAIDMIRTTDMTKLEIAEKCGFSSPSHFYKAFRAVTDKSPKDFESK